MKQQATLFIDLDDTLMRNPFELGVFPHICKRLSAKSGISQHEILNMLAEESKKRERQNRVDAFDWDDIVQSVTKSLNVQEKFDVQSLVKKYSKAPYIAVLPNVRKTLETLQSHNYLIYFVSNGFYIYQQPVIEALNLDRFCKALITPDKVNHLKSEKQFYHGYLDSDAKVSIGDSYLYDVYWPKAFGFRSFWIVNPEAQVRDKLETFSPTERVVFSNQFFPDNQSDVVPDAIVIDFAEVVPALKSLFS